MCNSFRNLSTWACPFKCLFQFHSVCSSVREDMHTPHLNTHMWRLLTFSLPCIPSPFLAGIGCCCSIMKRHPVSPVYAIFIAWQKGGIALVVGVFYTLSSLAAGRQLGCFSSCIGTHIWCCLPLYGISKTLRADSVVTDEEGAMFAQKCELL